MSRPNPWKPGEFEAYQMEARALAAERSLKEAINFLRDIRSDHEQARLSTYQIDQVLARLDGAPK